MYSEACLLSPPSTSSTVAAGQLRRHGVAREVAFAAAIHQHRSRDLRHPCDGLQRPGHHAAAGQRQVRLVAVGADTRAKARGQHHTDGVGPRRRTHGGYFGIVRRPLEILISGAGIAGPTLAYWLVRRGHRPVLVERTPELRVGGHAVDIRGTALEVIERMGLDTAVRDARTQILTLSAVRPDGVRSYDVALRPMHEARGDREIEIMRDDLVRILFGAVSDDVEVVFGDSVRALIPGRRPRRRRIRARHRTGRSIWSSAPTASTRAIRELTMGAERGLTHHLGAYLSIYTVDNLLGLRDRAVLYNEPGRAAAMFTVRGNQRAKVVLLFRSPPLDIDFGDPVRPTRCDPSALHRNGLVHKTFDRVATRRIRLLLRRDEPGPVAAMVDRSGSAARRRRVRPVADVRPGHLTRLDRRLPACPPPRRGAGSGDGA